MYRPQAQNQTFPQLRDCNRENTPSYMPDNWPTETDISHCVISETYKITIKNHCLVTDTIRYICDIVQYYRCSTIAQSEPELVPELGV